MPLRPIILSRRQIKTCDRVGGAELILPWPDDLPRGPALGDAGVRDATPGEHAYACALVDDASRAADLVPVRSSVAVLQRPYTLPRGGQVEHHLIVLLIGRRWVHATGAPQPAECWYAGERIGTA